jgi:dipeptidyl-peptidase-4
MTCLAMLRAGDTFKAGFAGAPVTDWRYYDTIYTERYMGLPKDNPNGYRDSSPVNYAAGLRGKLLIAHASGDDNVHFGNTLGLADKLVDAEKYAEFLIYAGRGHGISDAPARIHVFNRVTQFFVENLGHSMRRSRGRPRRTPVVDATITSGRERGSAALTCRPSLRVC